MKKELVKYFVVYIYGMVMLFAMSKKQNAMGSTATNEFKTKSAISTRVNEAEKSAAEKFFSSNQKFTVQFSNNELSFLY